MNAAENREALRFESDRLPELGDVKPSANARLDSWKEIASYLRRSIRCVQRWERKEGLPILRHRHVHGATVYAYRQELDDWWNKAETSYKLRRVHEKRPEHIDVDFPSASLLTCSQNF